MTKCRVITDPHTNIQPAEYYFEVPDNTPDEIIVLVAKGVLFNHYWTPDRLSFKVQKQPVQWVNI